MGNAEYMGYQRRVHGDSSLESQVELTVLDFDFPAKNKKVAAAAPFHAPLIHQQQKK